MTDRELLELAGKAIEEHKAWQARNVARLALRRFYKEYNDDCGYFDRDQCEPEDAAKFDALTAAVKAAQKALTTKRAATRRAIAKAQP